jgi:DNA-binding beta-propeller fold protein YncE
MFSSPFRHSILSTGLAVAVLAVPLASQGEPDPPPASAPAYSLTATVPIGLQGYTDLDEDPATGRIYLALRDGLRVVDPATGEIGTQQRHLEMSGTLEVGSDINRIFAEINDDYVGFIDLRSYHLDHLVPVESPGRLVYEPATEELYVFSAREPRVFIFNGRTGDQKRVIDLPGWGGDGLLKTPGKIWVVVPPKRGLYVIDTAERQLKEFPMSTPLRNLPARFEIAADAAGRVLYALDDFRILAVDAESGQRIASAQRGAKTLMYDDASGLLMAHLSEPDHPLMKLVAYRLEGDTLVRVSEQRLPLEGGLYPFQTTRGFVSGFFTGSVGSEGAPPFARSYFTSWQRQGR